MVDEMQKVKIDLVIPADFLAVCEGCKLYPQIIVDNQMTTVACCGTFVKHGALYEAFVKWNGLMGLIK